MFGIDVCMSVVSVAKSMEGMTPEQRKQYIEFMSIPEKEKPKDNSSQLWSYGVIGFIFGLSL